MKAKSEALYKLTDAAGYTRRGKPNETLWTPGKPVRVKFAGTLCEPGCLHVYRSPLVAVFMDCIHGQYLPERGKLWESNGVVKLDDGTKVGCARLTVVKEIEISKLSTAVRVRTAIYCEQLGRRRASWQMWAGKWLSGEDRSEAAAKRPAEATWAVDAAVEAAAARPRAARAAAKAAEAAAREARAAGELFDLHAIIVRAIEYEAKGVRPC